MKNQDKTKTVTAKTAPTPPPTTRPGALNTLARVREELAKLYRDARTGRVKVGDASKLAHVLQILAKLIEGSALEWKMRELERTIENEIAKSGKTY